MATTNDLLNSCIRLEETRISRRITVPSQVYFDLNSLVLEDIERIKRSTHKVVLTPSKLANLRYYILLNFLEQIPLARFCATKTFIARSPLAFSTNYQFSDRRSPITLFRSTIEPEGKISHQIPQQLWEDPQLLQRISQAHYWLIAEILTQLPLKGDRRVIWLARAGLILITILIVIAIYYFWSLNVWWLLVIASSLFYGIKIIWIEIGLQYFKILIIYHILYGLLANSTKKRQIGFSILNSTVLSL